MNASNEPNSLAEMRESWDRIVSDLKPAMEAMHRKREEALGLCRSAIQTASRSIRHVHRRQFEEASRLLEEGWSLLARAREALRDHPALFFAGYLQDAEKEMIEAAAVIGIVKGDRLPHPSETGVEITSYLNGMGEAASECRRYVLDEMRTGSLVEAERILGAMEMIYDDLIGFDYADSLTGGLRRTCDALRGVIERTRGDLTLTASQRELLEELRRNGRPSAS